MKKIKERSTYEDAYELFGQVGAETVKRIARDYSSTEAQLIENDWRANKKIEEMESILFTYEKGWLRMPLFILLGYILFGLIGYFFCEKIDAAIAFLGLSAKAKMAISAMFAFMNFFNLYELGRIGNGKKKKENKEAVDELEEVICEWFEPSENLITLDEISAVLEGKTGTVFTNQQLGKVLSSMNVSKKKSEKCMKYGLQPIVFNEKEP